MKLPYSFFQARAKLFQSLHINVLARFPFCFEWRPRLPLHSINFPNPRRKNREFARRFALNQFLSQTVFLLREFLKSPPCRQCSEVLLQPFCQTFPGEAKPYPKHPVCLSPPTQLHCCLFQTRPFQPKFGLKFVPFHHVRPPFRSRVLVQPRQFHQ